MCSFVPRKFDYHPLAIPAPYNHSNINSDEVIYYVAGNFMSRRGVGISSFTLHPAGIPHGPHPGTAEASIGKEATEELAVMVDTFHPLRLTTPGGGARGRPLPVLVAAGRGRPGRGARARRARAGGVPRLTAVPPGRCCASGTGPRAAGPWDLLGGPRACVAGRPWRHAPSPPRRSAAPLAAIVAVLVRRGCPAGLRRRIRHRPRWGRPADQEKRTVPDQPEPGRHRPRRPKGRQEDPDNDTLTNRQECLSG